jgi:hypothetical protein
MSIVDSSPSAGDIPMRTAIPLSILTLVASLVVTSPATATAPATPVVARAIPTTTAPSAGFRFSVAPRTARPGQPVTLSGSGCAAGSRVNFSWVPADVTPASVGELPPTTARSDGTYQTTWRLEPGFRPVRIAITAGCAQPKASATAILTISRELHERELRITQPVNQSGVTQGTRVFVRGMGCPAGTRVRIAFNGQRLATVTAEADGSFRVLVRIPVYRIDPGLEESSEAELTASCGQRRDGVVVVVNAADQVAVIPRGGVATGGGGTAAGTPWWPVGLGAVLATASLALAWRNRRRRA